MVEMRKSPLLAKIKFEPTFFQDLWWFAFSPPLPAYAPLRSGRQGEAGGKGGPDYANASSDKILFLVSQTPTAVPFVAQRRTERAGFEPAVR
jgi:hypothetical protein